MPTLKIVVTLELDGQPVLNSPIERRLEVDEVQPFNYEKAIDGAGVFAAMPTGELGEVQILFVRGDRAFTVRLDGQSDAGISVQGGGFILLVDADIDAGASTNALINNDSGASMRVKGIAGGT